MRQTSEQFADAMLKDIESENPTKPIAEQLAEMEKRIGEKIAETENKVFSKIESMNTAPDAGSDDSDDGDDGTPDASSDDSDDVDDLDESKGE